MDSVSRERVYKSQQNKIEIYVNTTRQFNVRHIIGLKTTHWQLCYRNIYHVIVCLSVENTYMDVEFKTLLLLFGIYCIEVSCIIRQKLNYPCRIIMKVINALILNISTLRYDLLTINQSLTKPNLHCPFLKKTHFSQKCWKIKNQR